MNPLGEKYETLAAHWLIDQGLRIEQRNFSCKAGEIDLIARHDQFLVFIEVRWRRNPRFASAAASVDRRKQQRLLRTAQYFLQRHPKLAKMPCRFDVIAIEPRQSGDDIAVQWIRAAFTQ